jgi:hypothetical protein
VILVGGIVSYHPLVEALTAIENGQPKTNLQKHTANSVQAANEQT